jgi:hypothetical protein
MDEFDVYMAYQRAKSSVTNKGFRTPKDWVKFYTEKLNKPAQENLTRVSKYFSTVWVDINAEMYFECGFSIFKKFSYHQFFDKKIMLLYKQRDKMKKNEYNDMKKSLVKSCKFVKQFMKDHSIEFLKDYCLLTLESRPVIIDHYLKNSVDGYFVTWMIAEKLFHPLDHEVIMPFVSQNYREYFSKLNDNREFLDKIKEKM